MIKVHRNCGNPTSNIKILLSPSPLICASLSSVHLSGVHNSCGLSILFSPPHSPVGLRWTPADSTGLHRTATGLGITESRWTHFQPDSTRLHRTGACKFTEVLSAQSGGLRWSPPD